MRGAALSRRRVEGCQQITLALGAAWFTEPVAAGTLIVSVFMNADDLLLPDDVDARVDAVVRAAGGSVGDLECWEVSGYDTPCKSAPNGVVRVDAVFPDFTPSKPAPTCQQPEGKVPQHAQRRLFEPTTDRTR